ncbi:MAG: sodium:solute symporter, partial [Synergistaceae bacterium]|nr:sodium:solute symporter [Synergistaceae bacterium]
KNESDITKGTVISTVFALVVAGGCYFLGGFGRLFTSQLDPSGTGIPVEGYDSVIPVMLSNLPDILLGVVVILVLSASMSTLSSLVLASSSTLTLDLLKGHVIKEMDEQKQVFIMRILIVIFIIISVILALIQYSSNVTFIAQLMGVSWGALAGAFLAPFMYSLYWKGVSKLSCWVNFIFSSVVMTANIFIRPDFPEILRSPINAGAFCMLAGFIIVPVISVITPKPDKAFIEDAFSCYTRTVTIRQSKALGDD